MPTEGCDYTKLLREETLHFISQDLQCNLINGDIWERGDFMGTESNP